jgi:hypothetical protein
MSNVAVDKTPMKLFLVTYEALIGRTKTDGAEHAPVELTFHVVVKAKDADAVNDIATNYSDPGFVAKVRNVAELADQVSAEQLYDLMDAKKVLRVQTT